MDCFVASAPRNDEWRETALYDGALSRKYGSTGP
jgi:hypothetical protein